MQIGFNTEAYDFYKGMELLPAGDYPVTIEDATPERAKDPASGLLLVTFVVAQGHQYAGRKLFYRLNLWNVSEDAKKIAHTQMKNLCYACGIVGVLSDTEMLKQRSLTVTINNDGTYNNVKSVKDSAGNVPGGAPVTSGVPAGAAAGFSQAFTPQAPAGAVAGGFNPQGALPQTTVFPTPQSTQPGPVPGPVPASFPPAGWAAHPTSPGWFYELANPANFKTEADLRAASVPMQPVQPAPVGGNPFANPAGGNPFQQPSAGQQTSPAQGFQPQGGQQAAPNGWPQ